MYCSFFYMLYENDIYVYINVRIVLCMFELVSII